MPKTLRPNPAASIGLSYVKSLIKPTPLWAHFYVTRHCNFACKYCGARDNLRKDPTFEDLCKRILKLKSMGCGCIGFMGGEPTLRTDLVQLVQFCSQNGLYTQLSTNGTYLVNPARTVGGKTLLERLVTAGLGMIGLSVDSVLSGFTVSGKEAPKVSSALEALIKQKQDRGLVLALYCVITKKNVKQVPEIVEFCHERSLTMAAIFAQDPNPSGNPKMIKISKKMMFSKSDINEIEKTVDYLIAKKKEGYQMLEPIQYYLSVKDWVNGRLNWQCEGGLTSLTVDTDGKVGICGYLPYLDVSLIDETSSIYAKIKEYRKKNLNWCTKKCLPSCMFCTSYYRNHPISLLLSRINLN